MGSVVDGDGGEDGRHAERGEICAVRGGGGARQLSKGVARCQIPVSRCLNRAS
jgi:hypothetical protein